MANVVDTKLYDILGVSPSASENELKKVREPFETNREFRRSKGWIKRERGVTGELWPRNELT